jgi:hypothetical protein
MNIGGRKYRNDEHGPLCGAVSAHMSPAGVSCPASGFHKAPSLASVQSGDFSVELVSLACVIELGGISRGALVLLCLPFISA